MPVVRLGGSALDVQLVKELAGSVLVEAHGETDIGSSLETTLATITVGANVYVRIKSIWCEGITDGLFKLYINSNVVWRGRNSWTQRGLNHLIEFEAVAGDIVTLKATNLDDATKHFSGGFYGYELVA
jgi:hypothetical protein